MANIDSRNWAGFHPETNYLVVNSSKVQFTGNPSVCVAGRLDFYHELEVVSTAVETGK